MLSFHKQQTLQRLGAQTLNSCSFRCESLSLSAQAAESAHKINTEWCSVTLGNRRAGHGQWEFEEVRNSTRTRKAIPMLMGTQGLFEMKSAVLEHHNNASNLTRLLPGNEDSLEPASIETHAFLLVQHNTIRNKSGKLYRPLPKHTNVIILIRIQSNPLCSSNVYAVSVHKILLLHSPYSYILKHLLVTGV
jgi:hypothetical protein